MCYLNDIYILFPVLILKLFLKTYVINSIEDFAFLSILCYSLHLAVVCMSSYSFHGHPETCKQKIMGLPLRVCHRCLSASFHACYFKRANERGTSGMTFESS